MARVKLLDEQDLAEPDKDVLARPINLYRALAHTPELARRYRELGRYFRFESALDARLRELAILQVGVLLGDDYETSHHIVVGEDFGVTVDDVRSVVRDTRGEPHGLGEHERTVLQAARELTETTELSTATWTALGGFLSDDQRVELVSVIGFYAMTVRIIRALGIEVEDSYRKRLAEVPELASE